jgi:hypothetical protein
VEKEAKEKALELIKQDKYGDFGPALLSERLLKCEYIEINRETLGLRLKENKLQTFKRRRSPHGTKRERKKCFGETSQIDGTFHRRFAGEEGGDATIKEEDGKARLLNLTDDATNASPTLFDKQETMMRACGALRLWMTKYGMPRSVCRDGRNMYVGGGNKDKEKNDLNNPKGRFRTMRDDLNVNVMEADGPQAKGRMERSNGARQDRLAKALRFNNAASVKEADRCLMNEYADERNKRFSFSSLGNGITDMHGRLNKDTSLNDMCRAEETRKVNNDWTASYKGRLCRLKKRSQYRPPAKSAVICQKGYGRKYFYILSQYSDRICINKLEAIRHFYFGQNTTFLFCYDNNFRGYVILIDLCAKSIPYCVFLFKF